MRGLKTQESKLFERYWELVQNAAAGEGCVFFGYAGEGREFATTDMEGEDFGGWLVPIRNADAFEKLWMKDTKPLFQGNVLGSVFTFAVWEKHGGSVSVSFEDYQ